MTENVHAHSAPAPGRQQTPQRLAVVVGGNRIPFARSNGAYSKSSNQDMLTAALDGLVARFGLQDERIGEVAAGAVLKHSRDFNLTREAVLGSALSPRPRPMTCSRPAPPGWKPCWGWRTKSSSGQIESGIAGGVDSASDAPIAVSEGLRGGAPGPEPAKTVASGWVLAGSGPRTLPPTRRTPGSRAPGCRWASTRR